jgi:hypothetical protein
MIQRRRSPRVLGEIPPKFLLKRLAQRDVLERTSQVCERFFERFRNVTAPVVPE